MPILENLGMQAAGQILGAATGKYMANWNDERQLKQQSNLQRQQIQGNKEMAEYQKSLALQMWDATNYAAQRKQLEKAGLNVGLMYGMGGGGGVTANAPTGAPVSGGNAPMGGGEIGMGLQLGMQNAMMQAQMDLINAQTKNIEADTAGKQGDTAPVQKQMQETDTRIAQLIAQTNNEQLKGVYQQWQNKLAEVQTNIAQTTQAQVVDTIQAQALKMQGEAESAQNAGKLSTEAYEQQLKQITAATIEQQLRMTLLKVQTTATQQDIAQSQAQVQQIEQTVKNLTQEFINDKRRVNIESAKMMLQKIQTEFNTSNANTIGQWVDVWHTWVDGVTKFIK